MDPFSLEGLKSAVSGGSLKFSENNFEENKEASPTKKSVTNEDLSKLTEEAFKNLDKRVQSFAIDDVLPNEVFQFLMKFWIQHTSEYQNYLIYDEVLDIVISAHPEQSKETMKGCAQNVLSQYGKQDQKAKQMRLHLDGWLKVYSEGWKNNKGVLVEELINLGWKPKNVPQG